MRRPVWVMKPERSAPAIAATLALVAGVVSAQQLAPGVKRVCVPAEYGRTWECGTMDDPPPQRPVAPRDSPAPPAFLAPPGGAEILPLDEVPAAAATPIERPRTDDFPSAPERDPVDAADAAPIVSDAPVDAAPPTQPEPSEVATAPADIGTTTAPAAPSEPPMFLKPPRRRGLAPGPPIAPEGAPEVAPEVAPEAVAADAPSGPSPGEPPTEDLAAALSVEASPSDRSIAEVPTPAPEPAADPPPAETAAPDVASIGPAPTERMAPEAAATRPRDGGAFGALAGTGYTVQLAHAERPDGFAQTIADLGLDANDAYALPVRRDGRRWWMLVWSSFPDAASARAATSRLPPQASLNVGYPRRIALLQRELQP